MQDTVNETVEKVLHENPGKDLQEAEEIAYEAKAKVSVRVRIPLQVSD